MRLAVAAFGGFLRLQKTRPPNAGPAPRGEGGAMKRIVTIVLMMLIGGYGTALAQSSIEVEEATKTEEATKEFLGLKWGVGIGVMGGFGGDSAVEKASIDANKLVRVDEEGDLRPQAFLEMHVFLVGDKARCWRDYQRKKAANQVAARNLASGQLAWCPDKDGKCQSTMPDPPLMGFGPFVALQSSDDKAIDALALGVMWGFRRDPKESTSVNVGIGLSFDPSVQVLGGGLKEDKPLPTGETAVRLKKEGRFGWALMTSFTF